MNKFSASRKIYYNYANEHLHSPQQMVAITTYLQYKQWEKKEKKTYQ